MSKFIETIFEFRENGIKNNIFINNDFISNFRDSSEESDVVILSSSSIIIDSAKIHNTTIQQFCEEINNAYDSKNSIFSLDVIKKESVFAAYFLTNKIACFGENFIPNTQYKSIIILDSIESILFTNQSITDIYNKIYQ